MNATMAKSGFALKLRTIRRAKKLSQAQLAECAGVHRQVIARLELGENQPTWQTVLALAKALGCKPNDFMMNEDPCPES
jgi:transcriptional regulator with XRE-family HTH domain